MGRMSQEREDRWPSSRRVVQRGAEGSPLPHRLTWLGATTAPIIDDGHDLKLPPSQPPPSASWDADVDDLDVGDFGQPGGDVGGGQAAGRCRELRVDGDSRSMSGTPASPRRTTCWLGRTISPAYSAKRPSRPTLTDPRRWAEARDFGARVSISTAPLPPSSSASSTERARGGSCSSSNLRSPRTGARRRRSRRRRRGRGTRRSRPAASAAARAATDDLLPPVRPRLPVPVQLHDRRHDYRTERALEGAQGPDLQANGH